MFGALKRGRFRSLASLILVVNVVGVLQRKRTLAASRGFLAAARLSCYYWVSCNVACTVVIAVCIKQQISELYSRCNCILSSTWLWVGPVVADTTRRFCICGESLVIAVGLQGIICSLESKHFITAKQQTLMFTVMAETCLGHGVAYSLKNYSKRSVLWVYYCYVSLQS